ncbi:MAG: recombination regulator RecX [Formosimonas sp.]
MAKPFSSNDDSFEQFDEVAPDAVRTRQPREQKVVEPKVLSDADLRRAINTRAVTYLSRREYSRVELRRKLELAFVDYAQASEMLDGILDDLARGNWQSDARYAAQLSKVKGEKFGVARLKHEFKHKGLAEELVQEELAQLKASEFERAREIWRKKFGAAPADMKEKAKQVRFMAARGFGFEIVRQIIKGLDDDEM